MRCDGALSAGDPAECSQSFSIASTTKPANLPCQGVIARLHSNSDSPSFAAQLIQALPPSCNVQLQDTFHDNRQELVPPISWYRTKPTMSPAYHPTRLTLLKATWPASWTVSVLLLGQFRSCAHCPARPLSRAQHCPSLPLLPPLALPHDSHNVQPPTPSKKSATNFVSHHSPTAHTRPRVFTQQHPVQRRFRFRRSEAYLI